MTAAIINNRSQQQFTRRFNTDIVVKDDANYQVKADAVLIHNQGGTNVQVNGTLLYPDDALEIGGGLDTRLFINFGLDYDFNQDISNYPCLRSGNKLVISTLDPVGYENCAEPYIRLVRGNTATIDVLSSVNVAVSLGDPTGSSTTPVTGSTNGAFTIPAGALRVTITVGGAVRDEDNQVNATVLGQTWDVGRSETFEAVYDRTTNSYKKLGAIAIDGNGGRVFYTYYT